LDEEIVFTLLAAGIHNKNGTIRKGMNPGTDATKTPTIIPITVVKIFPKNIYEAAFNLVNLRSYIANKTHFTITATNNT